MIDNGGYSLKGQQLRDWIHKNQYSEFYMALQLNLPIEQFRQKLANHSRFNRDQLERLILMMGAEEAFKVIYFPMRTDRFSIFVEVFMIPKMRELGLL